MALATTTMRAASSVTANKSSRRVIVPRAALLTTVKVRQHWINRPIVSELCCQELGVRDAYMHFDSAAVCIQHACSPKAALHACQQDGQRVGICWVPWAQLGWLCGA